MSDDNFFGCYFPNHKKAFGQKPCNSGAKDSWCCNANDICLDNGYCFQTSAPYSNRLGRGSCTDSTWSSQACPEACADVRQNDQVGIYLAFDRPGGAFCCEVNYNTTTKKCNTGTKGSFEPFDLPHGNAIYNRSNGASITAGTLSFADLGLSSNSSTSNSSTTVSSGASSNTTSATPLTSSSTNIIPIVVGIAVPLGVLLIAALIACGFLFRQNRRLRREAQAAHVAAPAAEPKDNYYRQSSITSPAPRYDYHAESQTNWAPHNASNQTGAHGGDAQQGNTYYAKTAGQDVNAHEVSAEPHVGELPADNRP